MINTKFLSEKSWRFISNEQGVALLTLLAQHSGMDVITRPTAPGQIIKATLSGGPAVKTSYQVHPDGTVEVDSRIEWPEEDEDRFEAETEDPELDDGESDRIDCAVCGRSVLEDEYMHCPECEQEMCLYCYEAGHVCHADEMALALPDEVDAALINQMAEIIGHLNVILAPDSLPEEAAESLLALLDQARPPIEDADLPPQQAAAMQVSRKFEALERIREAADYAEAKMISREMANPTTWRDENGEYHQLLGDHTLGPRLSGRAHQISKFEQEGQVVLESFGIPHSTIEEIKAKRGSVLAELQGAIQRVMDNGGTADEKGERLREAVALAQKPNANRELQRLYAEHRWPLVQLLKQDVGDLVHVEMQMPVEQWDGQVWSRLSAISEVANLLPTLTPWAVRQVMLKQRPLTYLLRLAVVARKDLTAIVSYFEKNPDKALDVGEDVAPLFTEYTDMRVMQIVRELAGLDILVEEDGKFKLNLEVWDVG